MKASIVSFAVGLAAIVCWSAPAGAEIIATIQRPPLQLSFTDECHDKGLCRVILSEPSHHGEEWTGWYRTEPMIDDNGNIAVMVMDEDNAHWLVPLKDIRSRDGRTLPLARR